MEIQEEERALPRVEKAQVKVSVIPIRSVVFFLGASLLTALVLELLPLETLFISSKNLKLKDLGHGVGEDATAVSPTYAVYGKSATEEHLVHVFNVLQRFGYQRVALEANWDLLWAHDYPYLEMPQRMKNLQTHQVVNHLPGCGFITNKVDLCTTPLPFLPAAFRLPEQREEFLRYAEAHPEALFVEKHNEHRHIVIRPPEQINLASNNSFVQEFIQNPLLVDGHKFDIGIYVLITSVDPLRVYIYTGDVLFRYCPVKYYPFDPNNVDKYVVGDDYLPTWQVPSLAKYYEDYGGSMRGVFEAYLRDQQPPRDPSVIWPQVEDIVRRTVLAKEHEIVRLLRSYKTRNFFDLMRFDLIIDNHLKVHLMEANMSPNLSSAHFKPNSLLYEQILYSVLNLMGIGSPVQRSSLMESADEDVEEMITAEKNLATNFNVCAANDCDRACQREECALCLPCISGAEYKILTQAHREHLHRIDMKRIFPKPIDNLASYNLELETQNMTTRNAWMTRWFYGKCQYERNWCH